MRIRVTNAGIVRSALEKLRGEITIMKMELAHELEVQAPIRFRRAIRRRRYEYPDNTPATLASKHGATPLIDEANYINSFVSSHARAVRAGRGFFFQFYFGPTGTNPARNVPNTTLMYWLEYGTQAMPARPHIAPFTIELQLWANAEMRRRVRRVLRG